MKRVLPNAGGPAAKRHYRIRAICLVPKTPGKGQKTPDNKFAWCNTRQTTPGKKRPGKEIFVGCFLSGTRQIFCLVFFPAPGKKSYRHDASVSRFFFAGCQGGDTRRIYIFIFSTASFAGCLLRLAQANKFEKKKFKKICLVFYMKHPANLGTELENVPRFVWCFPIKHQAKAIYIIFLFYFCVHKQITYNIHDTYLTSQTQYGTYISHQP